MLVLSILSLVGLAFSTGGGLDAEQRAILHVADLVVCAMFFVDFLWSLYHAPKRWAYFVRWGWLDLLSSVPMIDALRLTRLASIFRIIRLVRGIRATKVLAQFILRQRARSAFLAVSLTSLLLLVVASIAILQLETVPEANIRSANDALWWSISTITTVGYGDRFPVTPEGRVLAAFVMVCGVALYGTLSGFVAAWLLKPANEETDSDVALLAEEVRKLRAQIEARAPDSTRP